MKIKDDNRSLLHRVKIFLRNRTTFKYLFIFISILFLFLSITTISLYYGAKLYEEGKMGSLNDRVSHALVSKFRFIPNYFKGIFTPIDQFNIDIKFKDLEKLRYYREQALLHGIIKPEFKRIEVPAKLTYNNKTYNIKMKLAGSTTRHLASPHKWSFRIKVKNEDTILKMKEFNLLYPRARGYLSDWIGHKLQKTMGLIGLRIDFVTIKLNGNNLGLYCLEESYDKRLIEDNHFKEGIIFKWSDPIQLYNKKYLKNSNLTNKSEILLKSIESFKVNDIGIEELFNLNKMARFFAINDLLNGGKHGVSLSNVRFYLNPITNLIEPIGREWENTIYKNKYLQKHNLGLCIDYLSEHQFYSKFFSNQSFVELYMNQLNIISKEKYLNDFFKNNHNEMLLLTNKIYIEDPHYVYPKEFLYNNQKFIRNRLWKNKIIVSYYNGIEENNMKLFFKIMQNIPIKIKSLNINDTLFLKPLKNDILYKDDFLLFETKNIEEISKNDKLQIKYNIIGIDSIRINDVFNWSYLNAKESASNNIFKSTDLNNLDYLLIDTLNNSINVKKGSHKVKNNIIIDEYTLICNAGTILDLVNNSTLIIKNSIQFIGSQDNPIIFTSSDSSGSIFISNASNQSILKNVHFNQLSSPYNDKWDLTGAVTFYESDVTIEDCLFTNNFKGDDYLNIIRSNYIIKNTVFKNVVSDAFDSDFCNGEIINSSFINCGNDAIDISGTNIEIYDIYMNTINDKGLSAGENSKINASDITITNSEIAICSKDMSEIILNGANLNNNSIAFTAYQKKSEFGPSLIKAENIQMSNNEIKYMVEKYSDVVVNGEKINANSKAVKELLYGVKYGTKSKK